MASVVELSAGRQLDQEAVVLGAERGLATLPLAELLAPLNSVVIHNFHVAAIDRTPSLGANYQAARLVVEQDEGLAGQLESLAHLVAELDAERGIGAVFPRLNATEDLSPRREGFGLRCASLQLRYDRVVDLLGGDAPLPGAIHRVHDLGRVVAILVQVGPALLDQLAYGQRERLQLQQSLALLVARFGHRVNLHLS